MQPAKGHVEQTIIVDAPPEMVYKEVNGYKSFNQWSPWYKMDPEALYSFEGPETGVGAKMTWDGKKLSKGSQWIEASAENQKVRNAVSYEGSSLPAYSEFFLEPLGGGTQITWSFDTTNDGIVAKLKWIFMEIVINDLYTAGLLDLKRHLETINGVDSVDTTP